MTRILGYCKKSESKSEGEQCGCDAGGLSKWDKISSALLQQPNRSGLRKCSVFLIQSSMTVAQGVDFRPHHYVLWNACVDADLLRMIACSPHARIGKALFLEQRARYTCELAIGGVSRTPLSSLFLDTIKTILNFLRMNQKNAAHRKSLGTVVPFRMYAKMLRSPKSLFTVQFGASEWSVGLRKVAPSMGMKMGLAQIRLAACLTGERTLDASVRENKAH